MSQRFFLLVNRQHLGRNRHRVRFWREFFRKERKKSWSSCKRSNRRNYKVHRKSKLCRWLYSRSIDSIYGSRQVYKNRKTTLIQLFRGKSKLKTSFPLTLHTETSIHFTSKLTGAVFQIKKDGEKTAVIECEGIGFRQFDIE